MPEKKIEDLQNSLIPNIQWTANNETFFDLIELVEMKYLKNNLLDANTVSV